jgi:8-oxo-dGTP pyrophosphatase MutT (NUDIX family)
MPEGEDVTFVRSWATSGAPLCRTGKPDRPSTHLVSYFVVLDEPAGKLLLVDHRKAGLLFTGGHCEVGDRTPWHTVEREQIEELRVPAVASRQLGTRPFFTTVTQTRGPGAHLDVSLWHLSLSTEEAVTRYDVQEFAGIEWMGIGTVLDTELDLLDPEMHRAKRKLLSLL